MFSCYTDACCSKTPLGIILRKFLAELHLITYHLSPVDARREKGNQSYHMLFKHVLQL